MRYFLLNKRKKANAIKITVVGIVKIFKNKGMVVKNSKTAKSRLNAISNGVKANLLFFETLVDFSELLVESPELKIELIFIYYIHLNWLIDTLILS